MPVNILCIGDLVGRAGRLVLAEHLPRLISERKLDLVIVNAENAAGGSGLTPHIVQRLHEWGVDAITLGDHIYRKREIIQVLETSNRVVRPANLSAQAAGKRFVVVPTKSQQYQVGVACMLGQLYMGAYDSPWTAADRLMDEIPAEVRLRVLDFHAEATSEKIAMGWFLNGRATCVFGTHTHVPTADARVLDKGTAFISDVGMTGPYDGVLGRRKDRVLAALTTNMPHHFEVAVGDPRLCGIIVTADPQNGKALAIERIEVNGSPITGGPYDHDDGQQQYRK
jgi:metallophosphoesterase (TIGR00282 family)